MMKKILATLMLCCAMLLSAPLALATSTEVKVQDASSFDVTDIFSVSSSSDDELNDPNSFDLTDDLIKEGNEDAGGSAIAALILRAINILTLLVGTFAFVMIVIGGIYFATAAEESRIDKGKAILTQAITGLILAFLAYLIVTGVEAILL